MYILESQLKLMNKLRILMGLVEWIEYTVFCQILQISVSKFFLHKMSSRQQKETGLFSKTSAWAHQKEPVICILMHVTGSFIP